MERSTPHNGRSLSRCGTYCSIVMYDDDNGDADDDDDGGDANDNDDDDAISHS